MLNNIKSVFFFVFVHAVVKVYWMIRRMLSLNFNNFLHRFSFLLAGQAKMEKFLPYEFPWTDNTGKALLIEDNSCVILLNSISFPVLISL